MIDLIILKLIVNKNKDEIKTFSLPTQVQLEKIKAGIWNGTKSNTNN